MTHEDLTLDMLRKAGPLGVHTFEMRQAYIGNPSERIARLELRGHRIRVGSKERLNGQAMGVRYFLEFDVERAGGTGWVDVEPAAGSLSTERAETPNEGAAAMTTVEARGTADCEAGAVSATVDQGIGRAAGAQLTGQVGRDDPRAGRQDGPSQGPAYDAAPSAISRVAEANLHADGSLFDASQYATRREGWRDAA